MAFERFWRWYDRASRADFGGTLLGFVFDWKGWISAAVGGGGGAVTFLKAAIDGRSPLDVWVLALVVVAALVAIVYFAISILEKSKKSRQEGNSARDIVGDSAIVTAPVRPPTDQSFPFGLHISNIWIQRPYLAERSVIHINLDGFNGTGEDIFLKSIEGQITLRTESLKPVGKLVPPTFVGVRNTRIDAFGEFSFTLEQEVSKQFAAELMGQEKLDRNFVFDGLDIVVQAVNDRLKIARLPLWDGAALVRNGEQIRADRMIFLRASQTPEIIELRSDVARLVDAASTFVEFKGRIQECIDRIDGSNHPIWLDDFDARNARSRFLQCARVARAMREDHGPSFGGDMETRGEVLGALIEAKLTLDRILSNYHGQ